MVSVSKVLFQVSKSSQYFDISSKGVTIFSIFSGGSLGSVVQSIVSLTSSLRGQLVKCFTTLLPNTLIFLLNKCDKILHCKSFSHFFNKNIGIFQILTCEI